MAELKRTVNAPTSNYLDLVDRLLADPTHVARAAAAAGSKVVGYIGDEIPVLLIVAAGALPLRLRGDAGRATPRADEFMESAFSPELRAIAERWLEGAFDFVDTVVFTRADDSSQRLYYYLCELQRRGRCGGPRPLLFDVARIARPASIAHSRDSTRRLARELGVTVDAMAAAALRVSRRDALLANIAARRRGSNPLPGVLAWRAQQAAAFDWRDSHDESCGQWLDSAPTLPQPRRVVLAGDAPPDDALHRAVESAGGSVVLELTGSLSTAEPVEASDLDAIADRFQSLLNPVLAMRQDAAWVVRRAAEARADAVVFWLIEEDEALPWEIARQMRALRETSLPTLLLTRQPWVADENARQQVHDFMNWSKVAR